MRSYLFTSLFLLIGISLSAQTIDQAQLEALTEKQWQSGLRLLNELVSMPNDAVFPEQIAVNIAWCEKTFSQRNWTVERLETGGIPLLLVEKKQPNAKKTVLFYFHVDGQAVDISKWDQKDAYQPVLKAQTAAGTWEELPMERLQTEYNADWRIFGRSTSDDKGPLAMLITAWDALTAAGDLS